MAIAMDKEDNRPDALDSISVKESHSAPSHTTPAGQKEPPHFYGYTQRQRLKRFFRPDNESKRPTAQEVWGYSRHPSSSPSAAELEATYGSGTFKPPGKGVNSSHGHPQELADLLVKTRVMAVEPTREKHVTSSNSADVDSKTAPSSNTVSASGDRNGSETENSDSDEDFGVITSITNRPRNDHSKPSNAQNTLPRSKSATNINFPFARRVLGPETSIPRIDTEMLNLKAFHEQRLANEANVNDSRSRSHTHNNEHSKHEKSARGHSPSPSFGERAHIRPRLRPECGHGAEFDIALSRGNTFEIMSIGLAQASLPYFPGRSSKRDTRAAPYTTPTRLPPRSNPSTPHLLSELPRTPPNINLTPAPPPKFPTQIASVSTTPHQEPRTQPPSRRLQNSPHKPRPQPILPLITTNATDEFGGDATIETVQVGRVYTAAQLRAYPINVKLTEERKREQKRLSEERKVKLQKAYATYPKPLIEESRAGHRSERRSRSVKESERKRKGMGVVVWEGDGSDEEKSVRARKEKEEQKGKKGMEKVHVDDKENRTVVKAAKA